MFVIIYDEACKTLSKIIIIITLEDSFIQISPNFYI